MLQRPENENETAKCPGGHCICSIRRGIVLLLRGELLLDLDELCVQALDEALRHTGDHVAHGFGGHLLHHVPHADAGLDVEVGGQLDGLSMLLL